MQWIQGFQIALQPYNLLWLLLGTIVGLVVGVLPAVGPNFGVALMLPFTFALEPGTALIFLVAIHASCSYGDSVTSILVNTPGGPGTVASCWDGYPMTRQGKGAMALGISAFGSFLGGAIGWLLLLLIAGPITAAAMIIGGPEYFALGLVALTLVGAGSQGQTVKGLLMACVGLLLSFIGRDPVTAMTSRFTFGMLALEDGMPVVIGALGLFAISQVLDMLQQGGTVAEVSEARGNVLTGIREIVKAPWTVVRAGTVGLYIGVLPALGTGLAGISSYLIEKKYSPKKENFGKGEPSGLVAAEVGKGACVVGDLIPTFTLGVPGSVTGAILMSALIVHGIDPGPRFMTSGPLPYVVFAGILLAQFGYMLIGLPLIRFWARLAFIPTEILAPLIAGLCFIGAYLERYEIVDIGFMLAIGFAAYFLDKLGYPLVCVALGLILGEMIETNFHRALATGYYSYSIFLTRPIAAVLIAIALLVIFGPSLMALLKRMRRRLSLTPVKAELVATYANDPQPEQASGEPEQDWYISRIELVFLAILALVFAGGLVISLGFPGRVGLFPNIIFTLGIVLAVVRVVGGIVWNRHHPDSVAKAKPLTVPANLWLAGALMVVAYALVYVVGLVYAVGLYILAMMIVGRQRVFTSLAVTAAVIVCLMVASIVLHVQLPLALWDVM